MEIATRAKVSRELQKGINRISAFIGNTPIYDFSSLSASANVKIFGKLEWMQMGESVKARPAFQIIKNAVFAGALDETKTILDATSGNTGIAYAAIARALGLKVTLCLPENASQERKILLRALGVHIIYTSKYEGTDGAQDVALELSLKYPNKYYYASQYTNDANWMAHYNTTGREVWDGTNGEVTHFVAGLGTSGTLVGTSKKLKEYNKNISIIGLQPSNPMHGLEGWKHLDTAKIPLIYDKNSHSQIAEIDTLEAYEMIKKIALQEGFLVSPSSAANVLGAINLSRSIDCGVIVTTLADSASKYSDVLNMIYK